MTGEPVRLVTPPRIADARAAIRHVFVRDLVIDGLVGIYDHEKTTAQRVRVNLDLAVYEGDGPLNGDIESVVCYEKVAGRVRAIVDEGHIPLVETFAERIAEACLADKRVRSIIVRVEKLDVIADAASVGVEIERFNPET